ncbi:cupin domain-containing protein [Paraburkholderia sediminicola]|uniref:cupin domain-containing protein n=1 Tax=Paraburkholderia sediminicola TaxID=458836 RepID=UPI000EB2C7E3
MTHDPSAGPQFRWSDSNDAPWIPSTLAKGVEVKNLGKANGRAIQLVRFSPGAVFPDHLHTGPEFIYVVEGEVTWNGRLLARGCVGVAEAGTVERGFRSMTGCVFLLMYDLEQLFDSVNSVNSMRPGSAQ